MQYIVSVALTRRTTRTIAPDFAVAVASHVIRVLTILHLLCVWCVFFFFSSRRRHTRFKCDWSSDVCSSDLARISPVARTRLDRRDSCGPARPRGPRGSRRAAGWLCHGRETVTHQGGERGQSPVGRGSCRGRGWNCVGAGSFNKKIIVEMHVC